MFYDGTNDRKGLPRLAPPPGSGTKDARPTPVKEATEGVEIPPTEVEGDQPLDTAPAPVDPPIPASKATAKSTSQFRAQQFAISTSPQKRAPATGTVPKVFELTSSDDSSDVYEPPPVPKSNKSKAAAAAKKSARRHSVTGVGSSADDLPAGSRDKGKRRAPDVGMRSVSPPQPNHSHHGRTVEPSAVRI